jgi:hypothetical protein
MSLRDDTFTANTKANKKLEPIPWGHHSSVPATRSGPRAASCEHVPAPQQESRPHSPLGLHHLSSPRPRGCLSLSVRS